MDIPELLEVAALLINSTDTSQYGLWGLFVTDKKLHCKPLKLRNPGDQLICEYYSTDVEEGLTRDDWNKLNGALRTLRRECVI